MAYKYELGDIVVIDPMNNIGQREPSVIYGMVVSKKSILWKKIYGVMLCNKEGDLNSNDHTIYGFPEDEIFLPSTKAPAVIIRYPALPTFSRKDLRMLVKLKQLFVECLEDPSGDGKEIQPIIDGIEILKKKVEFYIKLGLPDEDKKEVDGNGK